MITQVCAQNGAKTTQGDVIVPDHIPKVKVGVHSILW